MLGPPAGATHPGAHDSTSGTSITAAAQQRPGPTDWLANMDAVQLRRTQLQDVR